MQPHIISLFPVHTIYMVQCLYVITQDQSRHALYYLLQQYFLMYQHVVICREDKMICVCVEVVTIMIMLSLLLGLLFINMFSISCYYVDCCICQLEDISCTLAASNRLSFLLLS